MLEVRFLERKKAEGNLLTIILLALGLGFITIGIYREEFSIVFHKAINICLECIGIG